MLSIIGSRMLPCNTLLYIGFNHNLLLFVSKASNISLQCSCPVGNQEPGIGVSCLHLANVDINQQWITQTFCKWHQTGALLTFSLFHTPPSPCPHLTHTRTHARTHAHALERRERRLLGQSRLLPVKVILHSLLQSWSTSNLPLTFFMCNWQLVHLHIGLSLKDIHHISLDSFTCCKLEQLNTFSTRT